MEPLICYTTKRTYCIPSAKASQLLPGKWVLLICFMLAMLPLLLSFSAKAQAAKPASALSDLTVNAPADYPVNRK